MTQSEHRRCWDPAAQRMAPPAARPRTWWGWSARHDESLLEGSARRHRSVPRKFAQSETRTIAGRVPLSGYCGGPSKRNGRSLPTSCRRRRGT